MLNFLITMICKQTNYSFVLKCEPDHADTQENGKKK